MTDGMSTDVIPAVPQTDDNLDLPRALNGYSRPETERLVADLRVRNRRQTDQIQDLKRMVDGLTRENATLNGRVRDMTDAATRTDGELALARRENGALQAEQAQASAESEELEGDISSLMTEEGIKDEARRRGYVEEGETRVVVEGAGEEGSDETATSGDATDDTPWYLRVADFVFQYRTSDEGEK